MCWPIFVFKYIDSRASGHVYIIGTGRRPGTERQAHSSGDARAPSLISGMLLSCSRNNRFPRRAETAQSPLPSQAKNGPSLEFYFQREMRPRAEKPWVWTRIVLPWFRVIEGDAFGPKVPTTGSQTGTMQTENPNPASNVWAASEFGIFFSSVKAASREFPPTNEVNLRQETACTDFHRDPVEYCSRKGAMQAQSTEA